MRFQINEAVVHIKSLLPFENVRAICNMHSSRDVPFTAQFLLDINILNEFGTVEVSKASFVALIPCFCMLFPVIQGHATAYVTSAVKTPVRYVCHVYSNSPFLLLPFCIVKFG